MFLLNAFNLNTNEKQKRFVKKLISENDYHGLTEGFLDLDEVLTFAQIEQMDKLIETWVFTCVYSM